MGTRCEVEGAIEAKTIDITYFDVYEDVAVPGTVSIHVRKKSNGSMMVGDFGRSYVE